MAQPKHLKTDAPKHLKRPGVAIKAARTTPQVIKVVTDTGTVAGKKGVGISGTAVLFGTIGLYLVYIGIKKIPFLEGMRSILKRENPEKLAQAKQSDIESLDLSAIAAAVASAGPAEAGVVSTAGSNVSHIESGPPVGIEQTTLVRGIRVHKQVAQAVGRMIDTAKSDGVTLNGVGGGWRSTATQQALRLKNGCTCSNSSSCCRVPTAPVGKSMHERGLAIDFVGMRSHSDSGWQWLNKNAARWGFKNLPSEPWHWSTNGH